MNSRFTHTLKMYVFLPLCIFFILLFKFNIGLFNSLTQYYTIGILRHMQILLEEISAVFCSHGLSSSPTIHIHTQYCYHFTQLHLQLTDRYHK
jgi:hypothetical protein